jgi:hypothetical protein
MKAHIGVDSLPARALARGGDPRLGRLGLSGAKRGYPRTCAEGERLHHPSLPLQGYRGGGERAKNKTKSSVRAKVEHPLLIIKRIFGFVKTRYKGLAKNTHRLLVTCALTNLYLMRRRLWRLSGRSVSAARRSGSKCRSER